MYSSLDGVFLSPGVPGNQADLKLCYRQEGVTEIYPRGESVQINPCICVLILCVN